MGQIGWRSYGYISCLFTVLVAATPALAQTQQQIDWCVNIPKRFSADMRLNGCNAAIESGRWVGKNLAWAIYNRGNAYLNKKDYCRAIADYDEAIRLRPQHAYSFRGRGLAYEGIGHLDRAMADLRKALSLGDDGANPELRRLASNPASPRIWRPCPEYLS
jgi:tetratricopeptide (TPR) repeat protein